MAPSQRNHGWIVGTLLAAASVGIGCREAQAPHGASPLPISKVVLYQNGVGYFERSGVLEGDRLTIRIRPSQINDLLKSLAIVDAGTGRAVSASLPLEENADRRLSELPEQVREAGGLLQVLSVFRGAQVELQRRRGWSLSGRVVGVENLQQGGGAEVPADWRVTIKTGEELVVLPVSEIEAVSLLDQTLSVGLDRSLDVSLGEGEWKPITLTVRLAGADEHRVTASYIVEMPRWKPAYRLVLGEEQPLLQGWAVVDNVTGESWNDVKLSLVSGSPISFKYDLHAPQYAERADLTPQRPVLAAPPPPPERAGVEEMAADDAEEMEASPRGPMRSSAKMKPSPAKRMKKAEALFGQTDALSAEFSGDALERQGSNAASEQVGALFRYDLADAVTVPDRSSTLVNIVNQRIPGEEVVYFRPELNEGSAEQHPYRAVKINNKTSLTLEHGPITVYSEGTFMGEGFLERMESGTTAFLTFAIDGKVLLDQQGGAREEGLRLVRIIDGLLVTERQRIESTSYLIKNQRSEALKAYVRTAKRSGWTLRQRPEGTVETPEALILPVVVPASGEGKLEVEWTRLLKRSISFASDDARELLRLYLTGGKASPKTQALIGQLTEKQAQINDKKRELERIHRSHREVSLDQDRVRANVKALGKTKGNAALKRKLAAKLAKLEEELGKLSGRRVALSEEVAELEAAMRISLKGLTLE